MRKRRPFTLMPPLAALLLMVMAVPAIAADAPAAAPPRVLLLLGPGFNVGEFHATYFPLRAAGYTVDVAGPVKAGEAIEAGSKDRTLDFPADLSLDDVKPDTYFALAIPGGGSPANLEKHPRAIDIVRAFAQAKKPIAAICHGPRLLVRAGVMKGRTATCLWKVKDELPDEWAAGEFGTYLDLPVVVDNELVTSRYPNDAGAFAAAMLKNFAARGGVRYPDKDAAALILAPKLDPKDRATRWVWTGCLETLRIKATLVTSPAELDKVSADPFDVLVHVGGKDPAMAPKASAKTDLTATTTAAERWHGLGDMLAQVGAAARHEPAPGAATPLESTALPTLDLARFDGRFTGTPPFAAAIVIGPGFDEQALAQIADFLLKTRTGVALIGETKGAIRGLSGHSITAPYSVAEPPALAKDALVIAPGGLWPESKHAAALKARMEFLARQHEAGNTLALVGFDSYYFAKESGAKDLARMKFAASDQLVWSFPKDMGGYSSAPAAKTADRLFTSKPGAGVAELLKLLPEK